MSIAKKGLSSFGLKIFALIFMTFDHIYYMLYGIYDMPLWFRWLGRVSAPLFIFVLVNGLFYTSNIKRFISRLYLGFVGVNVLNLVAERFFPHPLGTEMVANVFSTLFLIAFFVHCIDRIKYHVRRRDFFSVTVIACTSSIPFLASAALEFLPPTSAGNLARSIITTLMTSPFLCEGGVFFVIIGLGFYFFIAKHGKITGFYATCCMLPFLNAALVSFSYEYMFMMDYQWLMIFSLPFMLSYNGEKGKSFKYFFYLYYPLHLATLLVIAHIVA